MSDRVKFTLGTKITENFNSTNIEVGFETDLRDGETEDTAFERCRDKVDEWLAAVAEEKI